MIYEYECRKDCIHRVNGSCRFHYDTINSIFNGDVRPCIYFSSNRQKDAPSLPYSNILLN